MAPTICGNSVIIFIACYVAISFFIVFAHYKFWMFPITKSEAINDYFIKRYLYKIEELSENILSTYPGDAPPVITKFSEFRQNYKNWIRAEVGITAFLLFLILVFLLFEILK